MDPVRTAFAGFESVELEIDGVGIHARVGGSGPPVLLVHGYPQTHVMWHPVVPALAASYTLVLPDLRGYGDSSKPSGQADHSTYGKRAMAADLVGLMGRLGHDRFAAVGHDRGARVVHRMLLDHPDVVTRAAVLDIVPTRHVFDHVDRALATAYDHWFFLATPNDLPEHLIALDPGYWVRTKLAQWSRDAAFDPAAVDEYVRCFSDPAAIHASCEDYRAGASIDLEHDAADVGRKVAVPLLALWGADGFVASRYDVPTVWAEYADDVRAVAVPGGHFVVEEQPAAVLTALQDFLGDATR